MKNILKSILTIALAFGMGGCDFDVDTYQAIPTDKAFSSVEDVQNGMTGAYQSFGTYRFFGNNVVATGDLAADISVADPSSGHGVEINRYQISETDATVNEMWEYGFKVIDRCVRTIQGTKKLLETNTKLTEEDKVNLDIYLSQCHALRAMTNFVLVNLFALPYQPGGANSNLGLPLIENEPLEPFVNIKRSTVEQTYALIVADIKAAKQYVETAGEDAASSVSQFYFNEGAIYALDARVKLYMGDKNGAKESAQKAIDLRNSIDVYEKDAYVSMWSDIALSPEDIFTIAKTNDDNLSANALNTLYGSYGATLSGYVAPLMGEKDIRRNLIGAKSRPLKFNGIPSAQAVSNIPVFRKSEMYLIIAEAEADVNNITPAQDALYKVARRNPAITSAAELPSTKETLLKFISEERVREFFEEGHRWYEVRRTGEKITPNVTGVTNYDVSKFVYPIPADEINAGFCTEQNVNWAAALPK